VSGIILVVTDVSSEWQTFCNKKAVTYTSQVGGPEN